MKNITVNITIFYLTDVKPLTSEHVKDGCINAYQANIIAEQINWLLYKCNIDQI